MNEATTLTVIKGNVTYISTLPGLRPVMNILLNEPDYFQGSYVIDKVVGKASAMLLTYGGASRIHGITMSKAADEFLTKRGIEHSYDTLVDYIINNDGTDMCPMEKKVISVNEPQEAFETFRPIFQK